MNEQMWMSITGMAVEKYHLRYGCMPMDSGDNTFVEFEVLAKDESPWTDEERERVFEGDGTLPYRRSEAFYVTVFDTPMDCSMLTYTVGKESMIGFAKRLFDGEFESFDEYPSLECYYDADEYSESQFAPYFKLGDHVFDEMNDGRPYSG